MMDEFRVLRLENEEPQLLCEADGSVEIENDFPLEVSLLNAQRSIASVAHDAENRFSQYKYTSTEKIISACRKALHDNGLMLIRRYRISERDDPIYIANIVSTFTLYHAYSGESIDIETIFPVVLAKGKPHDKAVATALTSSLGYFLRDLLFIYRPDGSSEVDARNDASFHPGKGMGKSVVDVSSFIEGPQNLEKVNEAVIRVMEFLEAGDGEGLKRFTDSLEIGVNLNVWKELNSKERAAIKKLIAEASKRGSEDE